MSRVVIYIPGLADRVNRRIGQGTALKFWWLYGIRTRYFVVGWNDQDESYEHKKQRLLNVIDTQLARGHQVSIMGASAGASLALIALHERPKLAAAISICGKLRNPQTIATPVALLNPTFKASVEHFVAIEPKLSPKQRARILLVCPRRDAYVPIGDNWVRGAAITQLPTFGHVFSILASLTFFARRIVRFIRTVDAP